MQRRSTHFVSPSPLRRVLAGVLAVLALVAGIGVANADEIANTLDDSIDATAESVNLTVGGAATPVGLKVNATGGDGKSGCNLTGSTYVQFSVASSNTAAATVSPSSVRFNSCGDTPSLTVTPVATGSATVSLTQSANTTSGTFNSAPATFNVTVSAAAAPACPAAPTAAPAVVASNTPDATTGWYNESSLAAGFTLDAGVNAEYSLAGGTTWTSYGGEVVFTTDATRSVIARSFRPASSGCTRQDGPTSAAPTVFQIDRTAPALGLSITPGANDAGWNRTDVIADWTCSDSDGSGLAGACPADTTYGNGADVAAADVTVTDVAGNTSSVVTRRAIKVDTVAPTLSASVPAANTAGWNNTVVAVNWTCTDDNSGFASPSPCPIDESFGEADSTVAERAVTVTDLAGNSTSFTRRSIMIDVTQPSAAVVVTPDPVEGWNRGPVQATYSCDGGTSPLDPATPCPADESFTAEGSYAARSFTVRDSAGNLSETVTRRAVKIDTTPPTVSVTLRDGDGNAIQANANGWFNQAVTVDFSCTDPVSGGVASGVAATGRTCPSDYTIATDGIHAEGSFEVGDTAGNTAAGSVPEIRIDTAAPSLGVGVSPEANDAGWNRTTVHVDWTCSDGPGGSGVDAATCPADVSYPDGTNVPAATFSLTDLAGNRSAAVERRAVKVDAVAPTLSLAMSAAANHAGWNNVPVSAAWTCSDNPGGSGVVASTCPANTTNPDGANVPAADFVLEDAAGNTSAVVTRRAVKVDTVAPALTADLPGANDASWNNTVVPVDWTCTDDNSGFATPSPCPVDESFGESDSPVAERTVTVTDLAGNSTSFTRRAILIDVTQPGAAVVVAPDGVDGWNNGPVTATYTCSDEAGGSQLDPATPCPANESFSSEGAYEAVTFGVRDTAGNASPVGTRRVVRIDTTPPAVTVELRNGHGALVAPNAAGWFNGPVTVDFTCSDPLGGGVASGVATAGAPCPADYTVSADGVHAAIEYEVADVAGNRTAGTVPEIRIDTTAPVNAVLVGGAPFAGGQSFVVGNAPDVTCSTSDGLSGVAAAATRTVTGGNAAGVGLFTVTCSGGADRAGNAADTVQVSYTVGYGFVGFFHPISDPAATPSSFRKGSTVPVKFTLADGAGRRISDADGAAIAAVCDARLAWATTAATGTAAGAPANSNPANTDRCFRYDAAGDQFVYNLGTKDFTVGAYRLTAQVIAGGAVHTAHSVVIAVQ